MEIKSNATQAPKWITHQAPVSKLATSGATVAPQVGLGVDMLSISSKVKEVSAPKPELSHVGKAMAKAIDAPFKHGNHVEFFIDGNEAFPALHKHIESAQKRIDMEYFSFFNDEAGNKIADRLIAKAQSGVEVNMILNHGNTFNHQEIADKMIAGGVRVNYFDNGHAQPTIDLNGSKPGGEKVLLDGATLHPESTVDHRKITLVDGKAAMTGGMNIGDPYEKFWHDGMIKVKGPVVQDFYDAFEKNWSLSHGEALTPVVVDTIPQGKVPAQLSLTAPGQDDVRKTMLAAFDAAQHEIQITSPYFIDEDIIKGLEKANKRGVKVKVTIPSKGDNPMVDIMNDSVSNRLLKGGVKVYRYDTMNYDFPKHDHATDHFNHIKSYSVDGQVGSFGTANVDTRSMKRNQELMLNFDHAEPTRTLNQRLFEKDLATLAKAAEKVEMDGMKKVQAAVLNGLRRFF